MTALHILSCDLARTWTLSWPCSPHWVCLVTVPSTWTLSDDRALLMDSVLWPCLPHGHCLVVLTNTVSWPCSPHGTVSWPCLLHGQSHDLAVHEQSCDPALRMDTCSDWSCPPRTHCLVTLPFTWTLLTLPSTWTLSHDLALHVDTCLVTLLSTCTLNLAYHMYTVSWPCPSHGHCPMMLQLQLVKRGNIDAHLNVESFWCWQWSLVHWCPLEISIPTNTFLERITWC